MSPEYYDVDGASCLLGNAHALMGELVPDAEEEGEFCERGGAD